MTAPALARRVRVARGLEPGDLLLAGGHVVNVFTGTIERADVVVADGWIAGVGPYEWTARERIDCSGRIVSPGLVDAHIHLESTLLVPAHFARLVVPRGTTAVIADPHEIGNVLGPRGIEIMLSLSEGLPLDCVFMAPSCVPASPFEHAGATIDAAAIATLAGRERVVGLGEMMNFPGVLGGDADVLAKVAAAAGSGGAIDGHCPGVLGRDLVAYASVGIRSDHECTTAEEAIERAALGMLVQVREGSMARNLDALLPPMRAGQLGAWCLCTDDILPEDLAEDGHLDGLLRRVVAAGIPAAEAIRHAALVPARHYGLAGRGAVSPGYRADLVVFDDVVSFRPHLVLYQGTLVAREGEYLFDGSVPAVVAENTIHLGAVSEATFDLPLDGGPRTVIGIVPDQIVTTRETRTVAAADGRFVFDPGQDVALLACIQRHRPSGDRGLGLVSGFGFTRHGAVGSSVGHDAHNLMIAGTNGRDMLTCAQAMARTGGGFVVAVGGKVVAEMPLPVAGLMSAEPAETVCHQQRAVNEAAAALGCPLHSPFGTLSFLPLTVIPTLRITDEGLFDVEQFSLVKGGR